PVGGDDLAAEGLHDVFPARLSRLVDLVADLVGIDPRRPELTEDRRRRALAGADSSGQPDRDHRIPRQASSARADGPALAPAVEPPLRSPGDRWRGRAPRWRTRRPDGSSDP